MAGRAARLLRAAAAVLLLILVVVLALLVGRGRTASIAGGAKGASDPAPARAPVRGAPGAESADPPAPAAVPLVDPWAPANDVPPAERKRYDRKYAFKDRRGQPAAPPDPHRESVGAFLARLGWPDRALEGHSERYHVERFRAILRANPWIRRVAEVGFNAGHSALTVLAADRRIELVSFDVMLHEYSWLAKMYVDRAHPGRHMLVAGDSTETLAAFADGKLAGAAPAPFDLIFVDGDHRFPRAWNDIVLCRRLAHERTLLVVDNVAPHRGVGRGVYRAWKQAWDEGLVRHDRVVEYPDAATYADSWVEGGYRFRAADPRGAPDWARMSRRVRAVEITVELEAARGAAEVQRLGAELEELEHCPTGDCVDAEARRALTAARARVGLAR